MKKLNPVDRHCVIIFDEISIQPHISLNLHTGDVIGFQDLGDKRTNDFADHALVFMAKGLTKPWKQPLSYMFTKSSGASTDLVRLIKNVVSRYHQAKLNVIATICDQGSTNMAAINYLLKITHEEERRAAI